MMFFANHQRPARLGTQVPIAQMEISEFDAVTGTNLRGVWLMARAEVRVMLEHRRRGSIINISSFVAQAPNAVVWLSSEEAAFVTGQTLLIDGGFAIPGLR